DLVLAEQELDALGQTADDAVLADVHLCDVDRRRRHAEHAPFLRALDDLQRVRVLEQRLRRNAPAVQAGAAERLVLLDDGRSEAQLRGPDRGDVAAGPRTNHYDVVFGGGHVI